MHSESRERETSFKDTKVRKIKRNYATWTRQKRKTNSAISFFLFFFSLQISFATRLASSLKIRLSQWNDVLECWSGNKHFLLCGMCSARSLTIIFVFSFFFSLKIKSHYLSTAMLLYVNNAPPRIFTGLHIRYSERRGHIRKEGLLNTLILYVSTRDLFFPYKWACR